jgi:hypothetical protein
MGMMSTAPALASGKPAIRITNLHNGQIVRGSALNVKVTVSNFKLVKPVLLPPGKWQTIPLLPGNQGHIHYVLDSVSNLVLTRDVVVQKTHTWTNVSPGKHTVIAYLATSQHAQFLGATPAVVHVIVAPRAASVVRTKGARPAVSSHRSPKRASAAPLPSIRITAVQAQRTPGGVRVLAHVAVHHFKLVAPVYKNPPLLHGDQGHIHYVLDTLSQFQASHDAVTALSHSWTHVSPGWHRIIAYLATSQHQQFPGVKPAVVRVYVPAGGRVTFQSLPITGGVAAPNHGRPVLPFGLGVLLCILGVGVLGIGVWRSTGATA